MHAWGLGGDYRSPYAPYQDRLMQIFALKAMYTLDVGNGVDLMARYKYISDEDDRVTKASPAHGRLRRLSRCRGRSIRTGSRTSGLGGCVGCDDREADYDTYGFSAGYQLHPDLYAKLHLRAPPGRADRRHDRRGAGGPRLRGEQRLRLRRVPDRQARQEPGRPRLQLLPVRRRVRRHHRLPLGRRTTRTSSPTRTAGACG